MASFHCLAAFLLFVVLGSHRGAAKGAEGRICSSRGLSFRMDNGMYWSSTRDGIKGQEERDYTCLFQVCLVDAGKVEILDYKNQYLSLPSEEFPSIKAVKSRDKPNTEFELYYVGDKVQFKAANQRLLSRIYYLGVEMHTIEAQKAEADHFTPMELVRC